MPGGTYTSEDRSSEYIESKDMAIPNLKCIEYISQKKEIYINIKEVNSRSKNA